VALHRGRLAGLAAVRELGFVAATDPATKAALARAEAFQDALWRLYSAPSVPIAGEAIICRCEEKSPRRVCGRKSPAA